MKHFLSTAKQILSKPDCQGFNREEIQILLVLGTGALTQTTESTFLSSVMGISKSFITNIRSRLDEEPLLEVDPDHWIADGGIPALEFVEISMVVANHIQLELGIDGEIDVCDVPEFLEQLEREGEEEQEEC